MSKSKFEKTFVMLKPDALHRGKVGEIISRIENIGLKIGAIKICEPEEELVRKHYGPEIAEKHGEVVRENLVEYITEFPVIAMIIEGRNAVTKVRKLTGESPDSSECSPGTIRGDLSNYSIGVADDENIPVPNLIHSSEDKEAAKEEIKLWFGSEDTVIYDRPAVDHIYKILGG